MQLVGERLLAYHCTRLLAHEVEWVRREGLLPLSEDLVGRRIDTAREYGYVDDAARDELLAAQFANVPSQRDRAGKLHVLIGRAASTKTRTAVGLFSPPG